MSNVLEIKLLDSSFLIVDDKDKIYVEGKLIDNFLVKQLIFQLKEAIFKLKNMFN